jgi:hypothetical protein
MYVLSRCAATFFPCLLVLTLNLTLLQGPLSSLNVAAHVIYRIARVRVYSNLVSEH